MSQAGLKPSLQDWSHPGARAPRTRTEGPRTRTEGSCGSHPDVRRAPAPKEVREPRRRLSPRIAGRNKWLRIEALQRCKKFVADYRDAWRRWCAGEADVEFPAGTYLAVRRFDVATAMT